MAWGPVAADGGDREEDAYHDELSSEEVSVELDGEERRGLAGLGLGLAMDWVRSRRGAFDWTQPICEVQGGDGV
jgi:hypothetical protein